MKKLIAAAVIGCTFATSAWAQSLQLGQPQHAGSGCPIGSVAAVLSPDNTKLSLLFDQYIVEAGANLGKTFDRKSCAVGVPVTIPSGYSVSVVRVDYRGYANVPSGGRGQFTNEYFFAGARSPRLVENFTAGERSYTLTDNVLLRGVTWSRCGSQENLRINTGLSVSTNRRGDDAMITLDSIDVDSEVIFHIRWRRCS